MNGDLSFYAKKIKRNASPNIYVLYLNAMTIIAILVIFVTMEIHVRKSKRNVITIMFVMTKTATNSERIASKCTEFWNRLRRKKAGSTVEKIVVSGKGVVTPLSLKNIVIIATNINKDRKMRITTNIYRMMITLMKKTKLISNQIITTPRIAKINSMLATGNLKIKIKMILIIKGTLLEKEELIKQKKQNILVQNIKTHQILCNHS